jgi:alkanesulfonate monooxygenase SsuD/methylene tetrahydromethanopterin reductase-like flavin-dependent oxidoreductase (luciferase family)
MSRMNTSHPFRFGVVATPGTDWAGTVRHIAALGYTSVLMPDGMQLLAPMPALAMAAASADIRVGTWVLAAPLRPPRLAAWEAHSMTTLTGGKFELGIGTGRPVVADWAAEMGLPYGSPAQRLALVEQVITTVRRLDGDGRRTPVIVAAGGPRALRLAAEHADIVTLATGALTPRAEIATMLTSVRDHAGDRADRIEYVTSIFVVGDELPPYAERYIGADLAGLRAAESMALLEGTPQDMADELQRRREEFGTSYVTVNAEYLERFAPVIEILAGR